MCDSCAFKNNFQFRKYVSYTLRDYGFFVTRLWYQLLLTHEKCNLPNSQIWYPVTFHCLENSQSNKFFMCENQIRISILSQSLKLIFFFLQCILNQIYKVHVFIFIFRHLHILELSKGCFCIQELNLVKKMSYYVSIIFWSQFIN